MSDIRIGLWLMGCSVIVMGAALCFRSAEDRSGEFQPSTLFFFGLAEYYIGAFILHAGLIANEFECSHFSYAIGTLLFGIMGTVVISWIWYLLFKIYEFINDQVNLSMVNDRH